MKAPAMKTMDFFALVLGEGLLNAPPNSRQSDAGQKLRADASGILLRMAVEAAAGHETLKTRKGFRIEAMAGLPHHCPAPAACATVSASPEAGTGWPGQGVHDG
jgi:hypothetical protein